MITVVFLLFLVTTTTTTTIGGNVRKIKHSKKTNANDGGISAALLLSHNQAAPSVYDPSKDFCFKDNDNPGKLCWNSKDESPVGNWGGFPVAVASCGLKCTEYDPSQDYCFTDIDQAGQYCWYPGDRLPVGNWKGVTTAERGDSNDCGAKCTDVAPDPSGRMPCVPAGGSFSGISETAGNWSGRGRKDPFQTCYEYSHNTQRCWSKSYYSGGTNDVSPYPAPWYECVPNGGDDWHALKGKLPLNFCDIPCLEVHQQYP